MIMRVTIDALRASPIALALVVINLMFLSAGVYVLREVASMSRDRDMRQDQMLKECVDARRRDQN